MKLPIYQIDAFTDKLFCGNPAAVVPLTEWLSDESMLQIAAENNLAETAFYVPTETGFHIRWFTPAVEVDLCGHATLATAYVIFNIQGYEGQVIRFSSRSGELIVECKEDWLTLNFPVDHFQVAVPPPALMESLNSTTMLEVYKGKSDYLVVLESEEAVQNLDFDIIVLSTIPARGIIVTAAGNDVDFVSRFFAPQSGIDEDPVTGSAHTTLIPYWAEKLSKNKLTAKQLSKRGGYLKCELDGERVLIGGQAKLYLRGEILVD
ncbi:PhzF family phenazine biosynthesis protein [Dyadobacter sediminis]|uniref:PhzF family phenazine biosynthesis protein n=1 Tax=Dyadobacter sediminis TaxID=1493691 RepID=A0A5R9KES7_9BACT|nr:PhzF family phenazine biosynthesis protein [Dyadobacter sediminis]TLU94577.1 PhzF family phenazine biosynthesis protein [Dyadobacter sediminis]GGB90042.1 isomerase [Dyadobacter sediminis]